MLNMRCICSRGRGGAIDGLLKRDEAFLAAILRQYGDSRYEKALLQIDIPYVVAMDVPKDKDHWTKTIG
jgi:hypothetical protein